MPAADLRFQGQVLVPRYQGLGTTGRIRGPGKTDLEKRFRILPAGVVSKKLIGDLKIAKAILS